MAHGQPRRQAVTIILLVEGETERSLTDKLREFLNTQAQANQQPRVSLQTRKIKSFAPSALGRQISLELQNPNNTVVVALIDVFPKFKNAAAAKQFLESAAKSAEVNANFHAHAAQFDIEAWLLPYWEEICARVGVKQNVPGKNPEQVNGIKPPSYHLKELYQRAKPARKYNKILEMPAILKNKDLTLSANACPEFKSLLHTLLKLNNLPRLP
jgi:hypothetical protein